MSSAQVDLVEGSEVSSAQVDLVEGSVVSSAQVEDLVEGSEQSSSQVDLVKESEVSSAKVGSEQVDLGFEMLSTQVGLEYSRVEGWTRPWKVKSILHELEENHFGNNVQTKHSLLNRQQDVTRSSRDRVGRVVFQHHSMIEHLVKRFKAPPKQIGIGSTPETGGWKFINQHGDVGHLNNVNLARLYCLEAKGSIGISQKSVGDFHPQNIVGPEFVHVLGLHDGTLEVIHQRLFLVLIVFAKQDKNSFRVGFLINDASTDLSLPSGIFQCFGLLGQRLRHHCRGNVLGKGINLVHRAGLM
ncbi:uncharacterized protein TNCV_4467201 [Trichonephila clavipes]|nr:uncharacterized protein TNCV_4467201 [Trichonephila clavipes]